MLGILVVFAVAVLLVSLGRGATKDDPRLTRAEGEAAVLAVPDLATRVKTGRYDHVKVLPLDDELTRVSFFAGQTVLLDVAVDPRGEIVYRQNYPSNYIRAGSREAQKPVVLAALAALFALMTLRLPLRRVANLDVIALLGLAATIWMLNKRWFGPSVWVSSPALLYLVVRCCWVGFGRSTTLAAEQRPVWDAVSAKLPAADARRMLIWIAAGIAALAALVIVPGGSVGDVGFASMSGATALTDGLTPYGNVTADIVHGDTYPFLVYLVYVPGALIEPVRDVFDSAESALWIALAAAAVAAAAIFTAVRRAAGTTAAVRQTIAWISFPPVIVAASGGTNDLVAAAFVALAVASIAQAGRSTLALSAAAWAKVVPVLIVPLWIGRLRDEGLGRGLIAVAGFSSAVVAVMLAFGGPGTIGDMLHGISFQAARGTVLSLWTTLDSPAAQVAFQSALLTLVVVTGVAAWRDRSLAQDPRRVCALAAAITLAMQLAGNYWSYAYLPWAYPLVAAALLWPGVREGEGCAD
ncbi:MAG: hypothetical protein WAO61_06110 [Solirubrobacterales bacterium]